MTPLAQRIVRESLLPPRKRTLDDRDGLLPRMDDVHCFEVSEIVELAQKLGAEYPKYGVDEDLMFLPFPKTWIEHKAGSSRVGLLIVEEGGRWRVWETWAHSDGRLHSDEKWMPASQARVLEWKHPKYQSATLSADTKRRFEVVRRYDEQALVDAAKILSPEWVRAALAIINTPRIIGQRVHWPHRGLERDLVRRHRQIGKFPLHAWTEIVLRVTPPRDHSDAPPWEAHLTGQVAQHWVRTHLRIVFGKLVLVKSHERGNPALGIKRSRYELRP